MLKLRGRNKLQSLLGYWTGRDGCGIDIRNSAVGLFLIIKSQLCTGGEISSSKLVSPIRASIGCAIPFQSFERTTVHVRCKGSNAFKSSSSLS